MKLHIKIKHNEKVCRAQGQGRIWVKSKSGFKSGLSDNLKPTEANLMKFYRKINHNEKVCRIHELVIISKVKVIFRGQVLDRVSVITLKLPKRISSNFTKR